MARMIGFAGRLLNSSGTGCKDSTMDNIWVDECLSVERRDTLVLTLNIRDGAVVM